MVEYSEGLLDSVFGAISNPTRRAILERLAEGPARVTEIARNFRVSLNAVSKHLMVLQRAGLIRRDIRGRDHICSLEAQPLNEASTWIETMQAFWDVRLDALEQHVVGRRKGKRS